MIERSYNAIKASLEGGVLTLTLNNPARKNAIGPVMASELLYALEDARADPAVRAVVLTGAGDAFCSGGDFAQMSGPSMGLRSAEPSSAPNPAGVAGSELPIKGDYADLLLAISRCSIPVVARVNGVAMGGGLGLVAASHFAVAARGAKLGTPEINLGLFPMMIMAVLRRVVPRRRLIEMMLFGERFDADHAKELGIVGRVAEPADLDAAVKQITCAILSKSPSTVRLGLSAFAAQEDLDLEAALPLLRERLHACLATDDAREGLTAFLEKRPPKWTGK